MSKEQAKEQIKVTGGPAYPCGKAVEWYDGGEVKATASGLTILDYFAGQALAGLLAADGHTTDMNEDVEVAYDYAELMIEERKKRVTR